MNTSLRDPHCLTLPARPPRVSSLSGTRIAWMVPAIVLLVAVVIAGCLYAHFLDVHRSLWDAPYHDRNAHYLYSLKMATSVRNGHFLQLLGQLNEGRIWPPLHGMSAAAVLVVGGPDYRLAVLPSLAGWVVAVLMAFLAARRSVREGSTLAGLVAALFLAASPAHRAYATDVMLESLGAALSLTAIYFYLLTVQGRTDETWKPRCLALTLLALFLEKYNYWLLVVLALVLSEFLTRPRFYYEVARRFPRDIDWHRCREQLRHPLIWAAGAVLALSAYVFCRGDRPFVVGQHTVSLYPPHNLIHAVYVLLFLRLAAWWWRRGRMLVRQLDDRLRQLILWNVCPLALWFLLPKRPSYFLWYLSLGNRTPDQKLDVVGGLRNYASWFVEDYHAGLMAALLALGLCTIGLLAWRRVRRGGAAVLVLAVLAAALTIVHPNQKGRMLHSWVASVWVTAGIGAAALVYSRGTTRWPRLRSWLAGGVVVGLAGMQWTILTSAGHALEGGPHPERPSMLQATDTYLPELDTARRTLLLTAVPLKPLAQWTFLQRHGSFDRLDERWYGFGSPGEENRRGFVEWLQTTDCDTLVYCESTGARGAEDVGPECQLHEELKDLLQAQKTFRLVRQREIAVLACRVQVWRRDAPP